MQGNELVAQMPGQNRCVPQIGGKPQIPMFSGSTAKDLRRVRECRAMHCEEKANIVQVGSLMSESFGV